ncbi:MAG: GH32 C-terminal domain-containing protein [Clostridia bacterium]
MNYLKKAREYVKHNTIPQSEKCLVHLTPETGWLNDPNGFSYYNGKYHMFYQFHPYSTQWSSMHWGHATSDDCVKWEYQPVALAPKLPTPSGKTCYSGSGIEVDGKHYLIYTENGLFQKQCLAVSGDGVDYEMIKKPVIRKKHLPKYGSNTAFRDPKVWEKDGVFYCLVGNKNSKLHKGCNVVLFKSENMFDWQLVGKLFDNDTAMKYFDDMPECPDFFSVDGKDVLIVSPWRKQKVVYMVGKLNLETGKFDGTVPKLVDFGTDFFATSSVTQAGETLLTAWAQATVSTKSAMKPYGFNGLLTIPRKMTLKNDELIQMPVDSLKNYRQNLTKRSAVVRIEEIVDVCGDCLDIELEFSDISDMAGVVLYSDGKDKGLKIYYKAGKLVIDRRDNYSEVVGDESKYIVSSDVELVDGVLKLRVILDRFIVEVFVNDGQKAFSTLVTPTKERLGVKLIGDCAYNGEFYNLK